jgi:hypothetical protein
MQRRVWAAILPRASRNGRRTPQPPVRDASPAPLDWFPNPFWSDDSRDTTHSDFAQGHGCNPLSGALRVYSTPGVHSCSACFYGQGSSFRREKRSLHIREARHRVSHAAGKPFHGPAAPSLQSFQTPSEYPVVPVPRTSYNL